MIALACLVALMVDAQVMNVTSIERLEMPDNNLGTTQAVAISPQGDYLLLSTDTKQGLVKWDFDTRKATTLTADPGTGSDVRISADGKQVVYSQVSYSDKRRHEAVKSCDLESGKTKTLVKPTRQLQGFDVENSTAVTVTDGRLKTHALKGKAATLTRPVLSRHHLKIYITRDGVTSLLAPNGPDEHYIWASLSPEGTQVLYYVSGYGAFVCDTEGNHVMSMGNLTAPKWWDNNTIIGMDEVDDEYNIVSSSLVACTLDGRRQVLTGNDVIATYPLPCSEAGKIAFSSPDGKVYLINVQ